VFAVATAAGEPVGSLIKQSSEWTSESQGPAGAVVAQVRKTWVGLTKEMLTPSHHHTVEFTGPNPGATAHHDRATSSNLGGTIIT
jgi:hypothetical protein